MSTKTIALDSHVYGRLARLKQGSESFSKLIDRLVDQAYTQHTVAEVLARIANQPPLSATDAAIMNRIVRKNRKDDDWSVHDMS